MKYLIFDFDGTLADSTQLFMKAWNTFSDKYQYTPVNSEDLLLSRNLTIQQRAKKYHFPMHKLPVILPKMYRFFKDHVHEVKLFNGIKEMLDTLADNGFTIIILSSNAKENIELLLQQEQVTSVSQILTSSKLFGKDTVLKKYMKKQQVLPEEILYIGDEVRDLLSCNKVGVPFMWVSWGLDGLDLIQKENPKYIAHTPIEIINTILKPV
ncbi:HAD hydrolase-like protein [Lysinibacillus sp. 54212]|uniref:HAD hydrolase-like protein n=1 Tax=Lysinibacillus sp. 54212 TaxID=3119829 RepID=UPI002FC715C9